MNDKIIKAINEKKIIEVYVRFNTGGDRIIEPLLHDDRLLYFNTFNPYGKYEGFGIIALDSITKVVTKSKSIQTMQLLVDYHRKHSNQEMIIHDSLDKLLKHLESNSETFWMSYKKTNVGFLTGRIVENIGDRIVIQESYLGENTNLREIKKKSIVFLLTGDEYSIREDLLKKLLEEYHWSGDMWW